jgi:Protein of unknown function (DUF3631)
VVEEECQVTAGELRQLFLVDAGFGKVTLDTPVDVVAQQLRRLATLVSGADELDRAGVVSMALDFLNEKKVPRAGRLVDAALGTKVKTSEVQGQLIAFCDPEPATESVDGAVLLERLCEFTHRFLALPTGADTLFAAFMLYTYAADIFHAAVYIVLHSPAPQCGKTRALELMGLLVRRPWLTITPSTAVLFRVIERSSPTVLLDEAEVVRGRGDAAADVRALLQSGYRRGSFVPRCVGEANEVRNFGVFGPKVFALIGELPPALFDRCIRVEMQRRPRAEGLARFRPTRLTAEALTLQRAARRWADDSREALAQVEVPTLEWLNERAEEVWEPLFAVGLVAGGGWYARLREAAERLSGGQTTTSPGVELLGDIRAIFTARGIDRLTSNDLASALNQLEGHPWPGWNHEKGVTPNGVARLLRDFGVTPKTIRLGDGTAKGYQRTQFESAWRQYTPSPAVTPSQAKGGAGLPENDNRNTGTGETVAKDSEVPCLLGCDRVAAQMQWSDEDRDYDAAEREAIKGEGRQPTESVPLPPEPEPEDTGKNALSGAELDEL